MKPRLLETVFEILVYVKCMKLEFIIERLEDFKEHVEFDFCHFWNIHNTCSVEYMQLRHLYICYDGCQ